MNIQKIKIPEHIDFKFRLESANKELAILKRVRPQIEVIQTFAKADELDEKQKKQFEDAKHSIIKDIVELNLIEFDKGIIAKENFITNLQESSEFYFNTEKTKLGDLARNYDTYMRRLKEYANSSLIQKHGSKRMIKELIDTRIDNFTDSQKVDYQTKVVNQLDLCKNILEQFK